MRDSPAGSSRRGLSAIITHQEARSLALAEANRALELDPDSAEAEAALADLRFYYDWDWAGADQSYQRAIALNSSFARARSQYARYLAAAGRGDDAMAEAVRAAELDPTSASAASTRALMLYYARDYQGALGAIGHALQLESGSASAYFVLSRIDAARGALDEAVVANERALAIAGDRASNAWRAHLIRLRALSGATDEARAALARLPGEIAARPATDWIGPARVRARGARRTGAGASSCSRARSASASPTSSGSRSIRGRIRSAPNRTSSRCSRSSGSHGNPSRFP